MGASDWCADVNHCTIGMLPTSWKWDLTGPYIFNEAQFLDIMVLYSRFGQYYNYLNINN